MATLYELTAAQSAIEDALYENGGELTPELEEQLAETREALPAKIDGYNHILARLAGMEAAADAEIKRLQALKKTAQNAQKSLKGHLLNAMQTFGIEKIEGSTCKVFRRLSPEAVNITDETRVFTPFVEKAQEFQLSLPDWLKVDITINKTALKTHLQNGELVAGAELVRNESVVIK